MRILQVFALLFLLPPCSSATVATPRLRLDSTSLSALQSHSGQRVVLIGYFDYGFEGSALLPTKQRQEELDYSRAVWVEFADNEGMKFLGFPFHGSLKVDGLLEAKAGERYGHLGAFDVKLKDARIEGILFRNVGVLIVIPTLISMIVFFVKRRRRIRARREKPMVRAKAKGKIRDSEAAKNRVTRSTRQSVQEDAYF